MKAKGKDDGTIEYEPFMTHTLCPLCQKLDSGQNFCEACVSNLAMRKQMQDCVDELRDESSDHYRQFTREAAAHDLTKDRVRLLQKKLDKVLLLAEFVLWTADRTEPI
jgi:hypothetical protein